MIFAVAMASGIAAASSSETFDAQAIKATGSSQSTAGGSKLYALQCASCHGPSLNDGEFAPRLKGQEFLRKWGFKPSAELSAYIGSKMPATAPGSLAPAQVSQLLDFLLDENHAAAAQMENAPEGQAAAKGDAAASGAGLASAAGVAAGLRIPPPPDARPNPLDHYASVTDSMLRQPFAGDWLTWRRTRDDQGYSPLTQVTAANVHQLTLKWAWALPNGPNEATPLVHDGVLFAYGFGDVVQALDAENGDLLWEYAPTATSGVLPGFRKAIALFQDEVITTTSDLHMVALAAKTGKVIWDVPLVDSSKGYTLTGGPLVADGKVIVGTGGRVPGGNFIIALDAGTGKEAWRFATIPQPGSQAGDTWNGLPQDKRSGGAVWTPGSFDSRSGLVFFGPSNTYDTAPLRNLIGKPGSNDSLYTNSTLALDPKTGRLVWYFQHVPDDQWDLDWSFERIVFDHGSGATPERLVMTTGKGMVTDVLDAANGKYKFSFDLGLQDLISAIDPKTGDKTIDRARAPGDGKPKSVCPHSNGGKNWLPDSFDQSQQMLFMPLNETCMDMMPLEPGQSSLLSTHVALSLKPQPESDGQYGRLEAFDINTMKPAWTARRRAFSTTGVLGTAGGVVFAGYMDRDFLAFDAATGKQLWQVRLNDVPNSSPISYSVHGKQYIAIVVGNGGPLTGLFSGLVPEIKNPSNRTSTLWVFAL